MPELDLPDLAYEHWHRYLFVAQFVKNKTVLDIASGEGYGSDLLSQTANQVIGVDSDKVAIEHAREKYTKPNLEFILGKAQEIPITGETVFDVVVSFETIEHLDRSEQVDFLGQVKRLLKSDGLFIASTPNKLVYSDQSSFTNEFHKAEFYVDEFRAFLEKSFENVQILSQKIYPISYIWDDKISRKSIEEYRIAYSEDGFGPTNDSKETRYAIALCSNKKLELANDSILIDVSERLIRIDTHELELRDRQIAQLRSEYESLAATKDELSRRVQRNEERVNALQDELTAKDEASQGMLEQMDHAYEQLSGLHKVRAKQANQLTEILQSNAWAFMKRLQRYRLLLIPAESRRERVFQSLLRMARRSHRAERDLLYVDDVVSHATFGTTKEIPQINAKISVVIPTKNAGLRFRTLVSKLQLQKGIRDLEIIIVDSGSTDQTLAIAKESGVTVAQISPESFSHSFSRNTGADLATGDFILFTVQDAMPISDLWLWSLVRVLQRSKNLAVVSCAEYPRSDADLFYRVISSNHNKTLNSDRDRVLTLDKSRLDHFAIRSRAQINNVASLFKRKTFQKYRFNEEIAYAEDLELGVRLIKNNQKLGFLYSTRVIHSHNRTPIYFFKRAYVDTRFLASIFSDYPIDEITDLDRLAQDILSIHANINVIELALKQNPLPVSVNAMFELTRAHLGRDSLNQDSAVQQRSENDAFILFLEDVQNADSSNEHRCENSENLALPNFLQFLRITEVYMREIYDTADQKLLDDFIKCLYKTLALQSGAQVAAYYLSNQDQDENCPELERLDTMMRASI